LESRDINAMVSDISSDIGGDIVNAAKKQKILPHRRGLKAKETKKRHLKLQHK
jgi:hypothetical protein